LYKGLQEVGFLEGMGYMLAPSEKRNRERPLGEEKAVSLSGLATTPITSKKKCRGEWSFGDPGRGEGTMGEAQPRKCLCAESKGNSFRRKKTSSGKRRYDTGHPSRGRECKGVARKEKTRGSFRPDSAKAGHLEDRGREVTDLFWGEFEKDRFRRREQKRSGWPIVQIATRRG